MVEMYEIMKNSFDFTEEKQHSKKDDFLKLRVSSDEKRLIKMIANAKNQTISEFVLSSIRETCGV